MVRVYTRVRAHTHTHLYLSNVSMYILRYSNLIPGNLSSENSSVEGKSM